MNGVGASVDSAQSCRVDFDVKLQNHAALLGLPGASSGGLCMMGKWHTDARQNHAWPYATHMFTQTLFSATH